MKKVPLNKMNERDLVRLDIREYSRGQLRNYLAEIHERQRTKRMELDVLNQVARNISVLLSKGSVG